jgi:membrane-bound serine protease (ClpP class)
MMWPVIGLYLGAVVLILLEFVLPGGILGVIGIVLMMASAGLGIYAFPEYAVPIVIAEFAGLVATIILGLYILSRTGAGKALLLGTSQREEDGYTNMKSKTELVGMTGTVLTALRPSGTIEIGGERLDAVADGAFIDRDQIVQVLSVHGNRIVVEPAEVSGEADGVPSPS